MRIPRLRRPTWSSALPWVIALCVLAVVVPAYTLLYIHLIPAARTAQHEQFLSEALAISLRLNTIMPRVEVAEIVRDHIGVVLCCQCSVLHHTRMREGVRALM